MRPPTTKGATLRGSGNVARTQKCNTRDGRPAMVEEARAGAVNEDYVKTLLLQYIRVM